MEPINIIISVIIPFIVNLLDKYFPNNRLAKHLSVLAVCLVGAIVVNVMRGEFTGVSWNIFPLVAEIATIGGVIYNAFIKTGILAFNK